MRILKRRQQMRQAVFLYGQCVLCHEDRNVSPGHPQRHIPCAAVVKIVSPDGYHAHTLCPACTFLRAVVRLGIHHKDFLRLHALAGQRARAG